ncbi:MAG: response regulator, partial [Oscillochloris sp.]|nr:response regulator [Oscillochloris sp.]
LWCEISLNPIHMDGGISGISIFSRDLTERKRAEAERLAMERSWQETQRLESLGVLAGGIAHDFNNLLATILGNAELALLDIEELSPIRESLEQVELAARRAAEMTQQILAYAGKGRVSVEPVSLNAMVREMSTLLRSTLRQAPITYCLNHSLPAIEGDTAQLRQIVMNLIVNAAEAINGGPGAITITTDVRTLKPSSGEGFEPTPEPGRYVYLEVQDSGPGMSRATMAHIFEPFFTTKFTGRGLGLAAVQGIVRSHGGALRVESCPGQGTTFSVLLPALEMGHGGSLADPNRRANSIRKGDRSEGVILVIDDEPGVLQLTTRLLRRLGYTPLDAASHDSALTLLQRYQASVRCILLDWTMPGHSGEAAFSLLHTQSAHTPIVVISGYGEQDLFETTAIKPAGFLHKPFSAEALQRIIAQVTSDTA